MALPQIIQNIVKGNHQAIKTTQQGLQRVVDLAKTDPNAFNIARWMGEQYRAVPFKENPALKTALGMAYGGSLMRGFDPVVQAGKKKNWEKMTPEQKRQAMIDMSIDVSMDMLPGIAIVGSTDELYDIAKAAKHSGIVDEIPEAIKKTNKSLDEWIDIVKKNDFKIDRTLNLGAQQQAIEIVKGNKFLQQFNDAMSMSKFDEAQEILNKMPNKEQYGNLQGLLDNLKPQTSKYFLDAQGTLNEVGSHTGTAFSPTGSSTDKGILLDMMKQGKIRSTITPTEANFEMVTKPTKLQAQQILNQATLKPVNIDFTSTAGRLLESKKLNNYDETLSYLINKLGVDFANQQGIINRNLMRMETNPPWRF